MVEQVEEKIFWKSQF